ncbi:MAG: hypothetical protein NTW42_05465 [Deltaproteobacteria bacterium]|nr:hypothetical protein [Deltaproteobacteria bacterium]
MQENTKNWKDCSWAAGVRKIKNYIPLVPGSEIETPTTQQRAFRISCAIGWTVAAFLITIIFNIIFFIFVEFRLTFWISSWLRVPLWSVSEYGCLMVGLLYIAGKEFTGPLVLLFATRRARWLHRSMIWVLAGTATWDMISAPLALVRSDLIAKKYFFYDFASAGAWKLSASLLLGAVCQFAAIALHLFLERRRGLRKSGRISMEKIIIPIIIGFSVYYGYQKYFSNHLEELYGEWHADLGAKATGKPVAKPIAKTTTPDGLSPVSPLPGWKMQE